MSREIICLPGWGMRAAVWQPIIDRLGNGARAVDLPGYGGRPLAADTGLDALADAVEADLPAGATLCAWSLGALAALRLAARGSSRLGRLVLVGATPRFTAHPDWPQALPAGTLANFAAALGADPRGTLQRFIMLMNLGDARSRAIARTLSTIALGDPFPATATLAAGLDLLRDTDLRAETPRIAVPTLVIHGRSDPLMPVAAAEWLAAAIPGARLEVFADAAHVPFLADPDRFAARLRDFADEQA